MIDPPITVEEANKIVLELTAGEVCVQKLDHGFQLVRDGYDRPIELSRLSESALHEALRGWDVWTDF